MRTGREQKKISLILSLNLIFLLILIFFFSSSLSYASSPSSSGPPLSSSPPPSPTAAAGGSGRRVVGCGLPPWMRRSRQHPAASLRAAWGHCRGRVEVAGYRHTSGGFCVVNICVDFVMILYCKFGDEF